MVSYFLGLMAFWTLLFYALVWTERRWAGSFPDSSKSHENNRYWSARNLIGIVHAVLIAAITVPAFLALASAPDSVRFASTQHLAVCKMSDDLLPEGGELAIFTGEAVAFAGLAFTAFTSADIVISVAHGLATPDYVAHHVAFITAGLIIRSHCMLPYNAAILLAMEASTPFLNFMLFFRHRGSAYKSTVSVAGEAFVLLFVVFRLGINTYGAILLLLNRSTAMPPTVPQWQVWFLLLAVAAGAGVQFFWFPAIARTFGQGLLELFGGSSNKLRDDDSTGTGSSSASMGRASSSSSEEEDGRAAEDEESGLVKNRS